MQNTKTTKKANSSQLVVMALLLFLTGCGQIGPLYLPDNPHNPQNKPTI